MPPVFQLNGQINTMGPVEFSQQLAGTEPNEFNPQWRFPGDGSQNASGSGGSATPKTRRSSSARQNSAGGHRRLAHSEDLSRARMYQGADEDFLAQITAPNGGLAPPSTGRSVSSNNAATSGHHHTMSGSARVHPYRTGHDRRYSFGSNTSNSSTGSASPLAQMQGGLMQDAAGNLVQYSTDAFGTISGMGMDGVAHSPSASSVASGTSSQSMLAPPVPVVTSQATQAASASRRKSEALFACPIPGCGSTFTRQYNLRGHLRSHADERPYKCDWPGCDKSFARSHDCKRHQNLHLNIKPHTCEQCGKTFARLDALNRHHKSDTGGCTMKSDEESLSSTNTSSLSGGNDGASGSQAGSDHGGQGCDQGSATSEVGASQQPGKAFGGHVL
nr:potential zinc finger protein [Melanopsichium pennsylvanicum 4]